MHPNAEVIQRGYDAFAAADLDAVNALLAEDIVWHHMGDSVLAGEYHGKDAVFAYLGRIMELTGFTFRQEIHALLADDDHVVVMTDCSWDAPREFRGHDIFVWHVANGQATHCWAIPTEQAAANAALTPIAGT